MNKIYIKNKSLVQALFVMLLWGSLFPMVKLGYSNYNIVSTGDILFFAGFRFFVSGLVICIYTLFHNKSSYAVAKNEVVPILFIGLFLIILHYSFTYLGLRITDSSKTAILKQIGALFYVCFSSLFFKDDKLTLKKFIAALMGFVGIIAINADSSGISFNMGDALIIAASFCTVISNIISKKVFEKVNPITVTGISQLFGGAVLLVAGKIFGGSIAFSAGNPWVIIYICLASVLSYCIWFSVVKKGELSKLFIIKFAEPVFACIFGALILGENIFKVQYFAAFLLIAGGIYISNKN